MAPAGSPSSGREERSGAGEGEPQPVFQLAGGALVTQGSGPDERAGGGNAQCRVVWEVQRATGEARAGELMLG